MCLQIYNLTGMHGPCSCHCGFQICFYCIVELPSYVAGIGGKTCGEFEFKT